MKQKGMTSLHRAASNCLQLIFPLLRNECLFAYYFISILYIYIYIKYFNILFIHDVATSRESLSESTRRSLIFHRKFEKKDKAACRIRRQFRLPSVRMAILIEFDYD